MNIDNDASVPYRVLRPMRAALEVLVLLMYCASSHGDVRWVGKVVSVQDGDTVTLLDDLSRSHRIRISGIDAPEKEQAFGPQSSAQMTDLVQDKLVVAVCFKVDKYMREVCNVLVNGTDVGLEQIRAGLAWHYKKYETDQPPEQRETYANAELSARSDRRGLWTEPSPMAPWDWRQSKRGPPK